MTLWSRPETAPALRSLTEQDAAARLWRRDASLWKSDPHVQAVIRNRLGWLDLPGRMAKEAGKLKAFAAVAREDGFRHAVLLGMGGSSLCPEVFRQTFGSKRGFPALHVLDTTDPGAILDVEKKIDLAKTLFIVSSKSGGTIEVSSLFRYFHARVEAVKKKKAGAHFVAITDPGTPLEKLARERRFRKTFLAPPDVGGRYSALTYFGLVPAALMGVDVSMLLNRARAMAAACSPEAADNPGLQLGAALAAFAKAGRDKLTFVLSPEIASFGMWAEQLIAESTGKEGRGVVPVDGESLGAPALYGPDRVFIYLKVRRSLDPATESKLKALESAGHPVVRLELGDALDLAQEFFRWEYATAVAGIMLGINPFDEPNVTESKTNTQKILARFAADGRLPEEAPLLERGGVKLWADPKTSSSADLRSKTSAGAALAAALSGVRPGDYIALMAYVTPSETNHKALQKLRHRVREAGRAATTLGYGPRFLHSTGQLHKGGADTGFFLQITAEDAQDPAVPGAGYGFSTLKRAQALGDFQSLLEHGRRAVRVHLGRAAAKDLSALAGGLA